MFSITNKRRYWKKNWCLIQVCLNNESLICSIALITNKIHVIMGWSFSFSRNMTRQLVISKASSGFQSAGWKCWAHRICHKLHMKMAWQLIFPFSKARKPSARDRIFGLYGPEILVSGLPMGGGLVAPCPTNFDISNKYGPCLRFSS